MTIPPLNRAGEPIFEDLHIVDMVAFERSPHDDPLHRFSHVEPRTGIGCVQQTNAVLGTPLGEVMATVSHQIVQDQKYANGRKPGVELVSRGVKIPVLPATSFLHFIRDRWTLLEKGRQFLFEPGMQNGIRALIDRLSTQFSCDGSEQGHEFRRLAANILVILERWLSLWPPRCTRKRNGLIGSSLIFAPDLEAQLLSERVRSLNHGFFSCR